MKALNIIENHKIRSCLLESDSDFFNISKVLTDIIFDKYEEKILSATIRSNYSFLNKDEQMFIRERCIKKLQSSRKDLEKMIFGKVLEYISAEDEININGFITFRLREYTASIEGFIDSAVNEFIIETEYKQLIDGLIVYTELQAPLIDLIKVIPSDEKIKVTDVNEREIFSLTDFEDVLLDVILTLSPKEIIVCDSHKFKNKELLNTLINIYNNHIKLLN